MTSFRVCPLLSSSPFFSSSSSCDPDPSSTTTTTTTTTRMEFDYYHQQPADSDAFARYFQFVRRVALEDYELCERAQGNLERGVYASGVLHPDKEGGVVHYQGLVRERVVGQFKREEEEEGGRREA